MLSVCTYIHFADLFKDVTKILFKKNPPLPLWAAGEDQGQTL